MHENRETSEAPAARAGRWAKATSRKAHMHVSEGSDSGVVPMKRLNNDETSSAESAEGRPLTTENAHQSNTHSTQSGERVSQGLAGVRRAAKARKGEKFTALLHHVSVERLRDSFYALKRQAAPGVDGVKWKEYEAGLEDPSRIYTAGCTGALTERDHREECTSRKPTVDSGRWALRRWRTRLFNRPW
jgi:RNA-directed DNA polymerase